jgi:predicted esterase
MKKIISILLILAMMCASFALFSCDNNDGSSSSESSSSSEESSSSSSSSSEESSSEESSSETDPADIVNPDAPEDVGFSIGDGSAKIVYDYSDEAVGALVDALIEYIADTHGYTLDTADIMSADYDCEIIVGNVRENAQFIDDKLYENNDFAVSVCGNDLVLIARSEYLYPYMLAIAKELLASDEVAPEDSFIYHKSEYKDMAYAGYLRKKNDKTITKDILKNELFEAKTITAKDGTKLPYRIYIPSSYYEGAEVPVVLFLHGAGERGNDNARQLLNFVPNIFSQDNSPYWNAIVICPQCPGGNQWVDTSWSVGNYSTATVKQSNEITAVLEILDEIKEEFETDTNRYYVAGLSMGGYGTWDIIMRNPDIFAGAIAMCGGADESMAKMLVEKRFPVYALHGGSDSVVKYQGTKSMVDAMFSACEELGLDPVHKFKPLAGYDHNIWDYTGNMATYSKWLFEQTLEDRQ